MGDNSGSRASMEPASSLHPSGFDPGRKRPFTISTDDVNDIVTVHSRAGGSAQFAGAAVRSIGLRVLMHETFGHDLITDERLPVEQDGRVIGTLPGTFDPLLIESSNWLYSPRAGDFVFKDGRWIANKMLGPGDIEAVRGFVWERPTPS